ncbi:MAG: nuclear transport factor 2 family protein, partial [Bacteroidetes bacterium]|nr:nuclear transport factor 2 family protein [Bacteroidota bacterium]
TDGAVQVVRDLDEVWANQNWEGVREMLSDTAKFYWRNGGVQSVDEFMAQISSDSTGAATWKFNGAFSVDLDPTIGGEHVHAAFSVSTKTDSTTVNRDVIERYYIIDGKVVTWHQFSLDVK